MKNRHFFIGKSSVNWILVVDNDLMIGMHIFLEEGLASKLQGLCNLQPVLCGFWDFSAWLMVFVCGMSMAV